MASASHEANQAAVAAAVAGEAGPGGGLTVNINGDGNGDGEGETAADEQQQQQQQISPGGSVRSLIHTSLINHLHIILNSFSTHSHLHPHLHQSTTSRWSFHAHAWAPFLFAQVQ
jgi:hypothetical protein